PVHANSLIEMHPRVLLDEVNQISLDSALWREDMNSAAALQSEVFFEQLAILEINRHINLAGRVVARRVVLLERLADEHRGIKRIGDVFPVELAFADDLSFAHREKRKRNKRRFSIVAEDVDVIARDDHHLLLLAEFLNRLELIAIARSSFVPQLIRSLVHSP